MPPAAAGGIFYPNRSCIIIGIVAMLKSVVKNTPDAPRSSSTPHWQQMMGTLVATGMQRTTMVTPKISSFVTNR